MKLKITKEEYKKYPFPIGILLYYLISSAVSVALLELIAFFIVDFGIVDYSVKGIGGLLDKVLGIAIYLFVGAVVGIFSCALFSSKANAKKVYRGMGIMRFLIMCYVLCPLLFVALLFLLNYLNITVTFFKVVTLLVEFAIPFASALNIKKEIENELFLCPDCGLINSFTYTGGKLEDLGTKHKFHNEGGYTHFWDHGRVIQEVPRTTVYDGEFEKKRTTNNYCCSVCGHIKTIIKTTEKRVD